MINGKKRRKLLGGHMIAPISKTSKIVFNKKIGTGIVNIGNKTPHSRKAYSYIRFSTPEQIKGDSLRRQKELSEKYALENNLILDNDLKFQDLGISAFSGKHRSENGSLGKFLNLVKTDKIEKGSVLIVESLDRLSREEITKALTQFIELITHDITIVTLSDKKEYTKATVNSNWTELIISLSVMARAHEESAIKSQRIGAAWESKRKTAIDGNCKLTARCPAWLTLNKDKKGFTVNHERANIIRHIFELKVSGIGVCSIVKKLNRTPDIWKPALSKRTRGEGWRDSYIKKILNNPAVIGEFQPHKLIEGKRKPTGFPLSSYYPPIIDKELFFRVQEQFKKNFKKGGRTGKINNLFGHIAKCGYCGAPMAFTDKGPAPKGGKYLICDRARRGLDCIRTPIKYEEVERLTLIYCKGLKSDTVLVKNTETAYNQLQYKLEGLRGELNNIDFEIENILDSISTTPDKGLRSLLERKVSEKLDRKRSIEKEIEKNEIVVNKLSLKHEQTQLAIDSVQKLFDSIETAEPQEKTLIRLRLRNELRKLIREINIYPQGYTLWSEDDIEKYLDKISKYRPKGTSEYKFIESKIRSAISTPKINRCFLINYNHSGYIRQWVYPEESKGLSLSKLIDSARSHNEGWEAQAYRLYTLDNIKFK